MREISVTGRGKARFPIYQLSGAIPRDLASAPTVLVAALAGTSIVPDQTQEVIAQAVGQDTSKETASSVTLEIGNEKDH